VTEDAELARNCRLGHVQCRDEVTDAEFTVAQQCNDAQARFVAQALKKFDKFQALVEGGSHGIRISAYADMSTKPAPMGSPFLRNQLFLRG
jgi:hypothetical protein